MSHYVADLNRVGAQWCRQEQRAERSYAWPPGLQCPPPHTAVHGAHPQGTTLLALHCEGVRVCGCESRLLHEGSILVRAVSLSK